MSHARPMPAAIAAIAIFTHAHVARADATTQPTRTTRTIAVYGNANESFTIGSDPSQRQALASATDAALADAKQKAERTAKILGVRLGPPITVSLPTENVPTGDRSGKAQAGTLTVFVSIVFELVP